MTTAITERVRGILHQHAKLSSDARTLNTEADLYANGLSSFTTVQLMLALEEEFDMEFPDRLLNRRTFASINAIATVVASVVALRAAG